MSYNAQGNLTSRTDPKGRVTTYEYAANGIDLLRVKQKTAGGYDLLAEMTWDSQHHPLTVKDAAGQTTVMTYNVAGQVLSVTNPKGETTRYQYDTLGRLTSIVNPAGKRQLSYTYDGLGRIASDSDSEGRGGPAQLGRISGFLSGLSAG